MAKELAFQQLVGDGATVHCNKVTRGFSSGETMDLSCNQLFPDARSATH